MSIEFLRRLPLFASLSEDDLEQLYQQAREESVGPNTLLQAEAQGRLTELTINGNRAEVRVLQEGLTAAAGVTMVGNNAFVLVERAKAVAVPYAPR